MKLNIIFTAEITEDIGDVAPNKVYTEEQTKAMLEDSIRELCGENAEIKIHDCKLTRLS